MKKEKKVQIGYICSIAFLMICSAVFLGLFIFSSSNLNRYEHQALIATQSLAVIENDSEKQIKEELNLFSISNNNQNRLERLCVIEALSKNLSSDYLFNYIQIIKPKLIAGELTDNEISELLKFSEDLNRVFTVSLSAISYEGIKSGDCEEVNARSLLTNLFKQNNGIAYINYDEYKNTYNYKILLNGDNFYIAEVLKKGKVLLNLTYNGANTSGVLTEGECKASADKFLKEVGFSLTLAETIKTQTGYKFIYLPIVQNIKIYSRKVEVEISSNFGEVLKFDSTNYAKFDTPSSLGVNISPAEAQSRLNKSLEVKDCCLTVILNGTKQQLCYCFKVELNGQEHCVYINAKTGEEYIN